MNIKFFERLCKDNEFCQALGRMTLAAGRFESNLRAFLLLKGVDIPENMATLGRLTTELKKHGLLSENGVQILSKLKKQRDYLMHSLFDLFSARTKKDLVLLEDLTPTETSFFTEKAWQLEQNLNGLSSIAEQRIAQLRNGARLPSDVDEYLFRP